MKVSKTTLWLFLIFVLALVLRIFTALSVDVGPDEMVYSLLPLNIISAGRLGTIEQSPLYFYLTDVGYTLTGGFSPLGARLPSIIFGSLAVFLIYLISVKLFQKKEAGLLSAFLFAISGFALEYNVEMDMTAFFFVLLSILFFLRVLEGNHKSWYLVGLFFGLAVMIKNIVVLFLPAYLIVWLYSRYSSPEGKKKFIVTKSEIKCLLIAILIFLIVLVPIFSYNYLVYTEKGITDYYFSVMLGIGETVHKGLEGKEWAFSRLINVLQELVGLLLRWDSLLLVFGIIGSVIAFRKKIKSSWVLWLSLLFFVIYLAGQTASHSHYIWVPIVLTTFAGYGIISAAYATERINAKLSFKTVVAVILIISVIITSSLLVNISKKEPVTLTLAKFVEDDISDNAVIVVDPSIYRGIHAWVFNDKHYLEGTYFPQLMQQTSNLGQQSSLPFYYIQCGKGTTCGWKQEDFDRIQPVAEKLSSSIIPSVSKVTEINGEHTFIIYKGTINLPLSALDAIDETHTFWFYPVGWKNAQKALDTYYPKGLSVLVNIIGFMILYIDLIVAMLSIIYVIFLVQRKSL